MTDTFGWRLAIGAVLIAGGYGAWLIVPLVAASNLSPSVKTETAFLSTTPLLTKLLAIALLGRPTINPEEIFLRTVPQRFEPPLIESMSKADLRRSAYWEESNATTAAST